MTSQAGEAPIQWYLGKGEERFALPQWMARFIEVQISGWQIQARRYMDLIRSLGLKGKAMSAKQRQTWELWRKNAHKVHMVFNKKTQAYVSEASKVNKHCIAVELNISEEPEELTLTAGNGTVYRLMLLGTEIIPSDQVPADIDLPASARKMAENQKEDQVPCLEDEDVEDEGQEEHAEIGFGVEFDAAPLEDEEAPMMELLCGSSDEEVEVPTTFTTAKVKSFDQRAAYAALQAKGLTDIPRHIVGCSIGYHKSNRQWHGFYAEHTIGMTYTWGGKNQRTELEALLRCVRAILEAHLKAYPKDTLWKGQLAKVVAEEANPNA